MASGSGDIDRPPVDNVIKNSAFYDIGDSGIRIGRHPLGSDRSNHVVQFVTAENNVIQGYSRVFADGEGIAEGNGHDVKLIHNDITDGYHTGISICLLGCPAHTANGFNISAQYNHVWNVMKGVTSDGGAIYYDLGAPDGSGTGNDIRSNLIHDVTDSAVIDKNIPGYGYGGYGIHLDHNTSAVDVDNNVVFRVSDSTLAISEGPAPGYRGNTFRNNIVATAGKDMIKFTAPWRPAGCDDKFARIKFLNNIFALDRQDTSGNYHLPLLMWPGIRQISKFPGQPILANRRRILNRPQGVFDHDQSAC